MPATFDDEECYQLFIAMDNRARFFQGRMSDVNGIRERLLPFYRAWHAANPGKIHPSATTSAEVLDRLRFEEASEMTIRRDRDSWRT